jgi:hypothetical protein
MLDSIVELLSKSDRFIITGDFVPEEDNPENKRQGFTIINGDEKEIGFAVAGSMACDKEAELIYSMGFLCNAQRSGKAMIIPMKGMDEGFKKAKIFTGKRGEA